MCIRIQLVCCGLLLCFLEGSGTRNFIWAELGVCRGLRVLILSSCSGRALKASVTEEVQEEGRISNAFSSELQMWSCPEVSRSV